MLDNSAWAEALLALSHLAGDLRYSKQAAEALEVFHSVVPGKSYLGDHASRRMEEDEEALFLPAGAAWGRAKDFLEHGPVSMALVGDSAKPAYRTSPPGGIWGYTLLTGSCNPWTPSAMRIKSCAWASR